jgi:hypothetical protein
VPDTATFMEHGAEEITLWIDLGVEHVRRAPT